ncbi:hypothetical protein [Nannocystis radixulma]|uniref:Uncharacterized protein n=1 Tax=Nannocystis radixulma TaxID=2995305 RepID=A0ABT5B7F6_9BACT|nr:hypothetical protein [Nannocystis radixulma]MDC0670047.1 hypothetical protein [Nannocystis radixulma]
MLRAKLVLLAAERPRGPFRMPRMPPGELAIAAVARTRRESLVTVNDGSKFGQRASPTAFNAIGRRHDDSYGTRARGATLEAAHRHEREQYASDLPMHPPAPHTRVFSSFVVLWMVPPAAAAAPEGGCSPSFELRTLQAMIEFADPQFASTLIQTDHNDDGWLCIKFDKHRDDTFTFHDNLRQHGKP